MVSMSSAARALLGAVGVLDPGLPPSYAEGAVAPETLPVPELPPLARAPAAPPLAPTPAGHEPGLLEDLASLPLTMENVEQVLDDLVRPALNADGGDITLLKIVDQDVYVRLVGACSTCPSSIMTMKMGVERLLQEEFPEMRDLIQVDDLMSI